MTECQFSKKVSEFLAKKIKVKYPNIKIAERANILNSLTIGRINKEWRVVFGSLEQDIVLYQDEINSVELKNKRILIPRGTKDKKIIIPIAVCELKIGKNINTHQFITYGSIAKELKSVFPHCAYYFISSGRKQGFQHTTLLRHTKEFDRVFLNWEKDKQNLLNDLFLHLEYLKRLNIL